jgi:chloramphenicol O-acetyltransferase type B
MVLNEGVNVGNGYQTIDFETWKRKEYCQIYRSAIQPQYCVSFELDVTNFKKHVKENNWSFTRGSSQKT